MLNRTDVVVLALLDSENRILISKRLIDKPMGGMWEFPGGKIEADESPESALIREIKEELSISISKSCLAPLTFSTVTYGTRNFLILMYVCRVWEGKVNASVSAEIKWVEKRDLGKYNMPSGNESLIGMVIDYL
ncbi:MAG: 8-oxo-dGTP diphosphatase [Alphaproteobacteria bacterium MarineAlpha2_Bin1]|nr:MAG: 8-oxo-dGTP diphosphatase [Alphaproteobacteria bacterium MarineAlpha2_Bin1]